MRSTNQASAPRTGVQLNDRPTDSIEAQLLAAFEALAEADARTARARRLLQEALAACRAESRESAQPVREPLLSLVGVAAHVGLLLPSGRPANSLYQAVQRGELPAYRVSGRWRVRRSDVESWLARHRELPKSA